MKRIIFVILGCIIFLTLGFSIGYYIDALEKYEKDVKESNVTKICDFEEDVLSLNTDNNNVHEEYSMNIGKREKEIVFLEGAIVVFKKYYPDCDHENIEEATLPEELYITTENKILEKYDGWKIEEISDERLVLYIVINGECEKHYIIKEHEGKIGIFYKNPGIGKQLKQIIDINISYFREEDRAKLKDGIEVASEEELARIIEDFTS